MQSPEPPTSAVAQKNEVRTQLLDFSGGETVRGERGAVATRRMVRVRKNAKDPQEWRVMERNRERERQAGRWWYLRQISCYGDKQEGEVGMKLSGRWDCTGLLMICKNNCFILPPLAQKKKKKHGNTHRHYKYAPTRTHKDQIACQSWLSSLAFGDTQLPPPHSLHGDQFSL